MKYPAWLLPATTLLSGAGMIGLISAGFLIVTVNASLPDAQSIRGVELKVPLRVYSTEGLLISEFGNERRKPVEIEQIPLLLKNAVLASEDDRFYDHVGVDPSGLLRAALSNFRSGATQQGASTITMQVARNFFLTRDKTYIRKLREVLLAFKLERLLSKDEILSLYINKIFLGHRAYGFGAAADVYYARELSELTLAEIAMLAGLPKAPSSNNPLRNPERAIKRRNYVLDRLLELGKIDQPGYDEASAAPITAQRHARQTDVDAPHIAEMVRAQLTEEFGEQAYWAGLNVYTTIAQKPQQIAQLKLRKGLQAYDRRHGFRGPVGRVALDDLIDLDLNLEARDEELARLMQPFPNSFEQIPALVVEVEEQSALLLTRDHGEVELNIERARWARRHLTANQLGDRPEAMTELVKTGDVIYIQPVADPTAATETASQATTDGQTDEGAEQIEWQLSQLPLISGAIISIEPGSGRVLALVGGYDFFLNKYNRAIQSIRQPGSNIKPFIYSAAMENGFTPASMISGAPIVMTDPTHGTVWRPENYSGKFFGPTRMREALYKSMNLVSIRLLRSIGIPYTRDYLTRFGLDMNRFSSSLTMALGSGGVTPLELISAYAALANGGYRIQPYFIDYITDRHGDIVYRADRPTLCDECYAEYLPEPEPESNSEVDGDQSVDAEASANDENAANALTESEELSAQEADEVMEPDTDSAHDPDADAVAEPIIRTYQAPRIMSSANNFLIVNMLKDVIRRGTARKALVLNRQDLAGKTGTTNDYVDAWFTGFNSKLATTVWVGFDDPTTLGKGEAGSVAALPIWVDYMREILADVPEDTNMVPVYMEQGLVNRRTGVRTDELDPEAVSEYFPVQAFLPEPFGDLMPPSLDEDESSAPDLNTGTGTSRIELSEYDMSERPMDADPIYPQEYPQEYPQDSSTEIQYDEFGQPIPAELETLPEERIIEDEEETEGLF